MFGLAHRGWSLNDYGQHLIHSLRDVGYHSVLIGKQHISGGPAVIGYDRVAEVDSNRVVDIAPTTNEILRVLRSCSSSVGFFRNPSRLLGPTSVRDSLYSMPP